MRGLYVPHNQRDWEAFFRQGQRGGGGLAVGFRGTKYQRGSGIGNIFSSIFRTLLPLAKTVGKTVGRQALSTGAQVASDALAGHNIGDSLNQRGREAAGNLLRKGVRKMTKKRAPAAKKKRQQKGHGRRKRRVIRRKKQKGRGLGVMPGGGKRKTGKSIKARGRRRKATATKRRRKTDQLGTYFM